MVVLAATSPRVRDGRRSTIGSFGSLLPRPSKRASATSPIPSAPTVRQAALSSARSASSLTGSLGAGNWQGVIGKLTGGSGVSGPTSGKANTNPLKKASDTQGGVVKERDGYDVFFGVAEGESKATVPERDGFDIFYGIKNDERATPTQSPCNDGDMFAEHGARENCREAQLRSRISQVAHPRRERRLSAPAQLGVSVARPSAAPRSPAATDAKAKPDVAKSKRASKQIVPDSVPTFSLATPAPSFAPELVASHRNEAPNSVQLYSMATPCCSFVPPAQ